MSHMTERQASDWPGAVAEAQRYVTTSAIPLDIGTHWWRVRWDDESRPGRCHAMWASWCDGEYLVDIHMDVYGNPTVSVAEVNWLHSSALEECECEPCVEERESHG